MSSPENLHRRGQRNITETGRLAESATKRRPDSDVTAGTSTTPNAYRDSDEFPAPAANFSSTPADNALVLQQSLESQAMTWSQIADLIPNPDGLPFAPTLTVNTYNINAAGATSNVVSGDQINQIQHHGVPLHSSALDSLPYAEGASWSPKYACLSGTRTVLLDDIWKWIHTADGTKTAEIFLLSDVAGTGKSAIAHTVAQRCHNSGLLGSSFFFDRDIADRSRPDKLFSTVVRDLAKLSKVIAQNIGRILEDDRSLASGSQSRQFDELILKPFREHHLNQPVVLVIDGLDEGYDPETVEILRNQVPTLPGTFRIFVTSRPKDDIITFLSAQHVQISSIDIHGKINQSDTALYVEERLRHVAFLKRLGTDWPGSKLTNDFVMKAEGLFIWVSTVSRFLSTTTYPDKKLKKLLYERNSSGLQAEAKMDKLYADILNSCDWDDDDFAREYTLIVGAIMAVKTPLSMSALQSLHRSNSGLIVEEVLRPLSSLLTGLDNERQPVRILHLSLREFLTRRAQRSPKYERFSISEEEHNQRLALLCLIVMNEELRSDMPGTGYLTGRLPKTKGIPTIADGVVSEALAYACRFWSEHIINVKPPVSEILLDALRNFFSEKLLIWMEVSSTKFEFQSLFRVRAWLQRIFPTGVTLVATFFDNGHASGLLELSSRLSYMDRREDAVKAIREAVELRRQFATDRPATFIPDLATSLNHLSIFLSALGQREDALKAIKEAIELRRQLAADRPAAFIPDLAGSLNNLSAALSALGEREDALKAIKEAVELQRQLAADRPVAFIPDLAMSLNNLSNCLSALGQREDALKAIKEAVELRQRLAAECPAAFIPDLAMSLNNLSIYLSALGQREDALKAIKEAVELWRQLAAEHPAAFMPDFATSLNNLSTQLSTLGQQEEALKAHDEAAKLDLEL